MRDASTNINSGASKIKDAVDQTNKEVSALGPDRYMSPGADTFRANYARLTPRLEEAYQQLIVDIVAHQVISTNLVLRGMDVKRIFVDGGFSKNPIYMYLMAEAFPAIEVYAASVAQASALGDALVIHQHWNNKPLPSNIIDMKLYSVSHQTSI